jgi:hypothetical protein
MRFVLAILTLYAFQSAGAAPVPCDAQASQMDEAPPELKWLKDSEARATGKPILYYVTLSKGCTHCVRCDRMLNTPLMKDALLDFACVKVVDPPRPGRFVRYHRITLYPSVRIFSTDMKKVATINGCPVDVPEFLGLLDSGMKHIKGKQHSPVKGPLLPTLAEKLRIAPMVITLAPVRSTNTAPTMRSKGTAVADGLERSVIRFGGGVKTPGPLGKRTLRPQALFR